MTEGAEQNRLAAAATALGAGSQRSEIQSFMVMDVMRAAAEQERAGRSIIHMEVGQPGTPAPGAAKRAALAAIQSDTLGYTLALGNEALRRRIAELYRDWYGVSVAPERVVITTGSSAAFVLAFLAAFDAGDGVALASPGYPCYRHILSALGPRPVLIETGAETGWTPTADCVARAAANDGIKGLLLASPANPTGTLVTPERFTELVTACREHGLWLVSDEIYHGLTYGRAAQSALQLSDDAIVINSFSKFFSMTGWRIGWMVVPERLLGAIERLAQNLYISAPAIAQAAALGAFDGLDELDANRAVYEANRALLLEELPKAGFTSFAPADGAFYLYCDVSEMTNDAVSFAKAMLEEAGVATTPGVDFDAERGHRFLRFCYAGTRQDMAEAARRIAEWAPTRRQR
jgi:aspartate/methionine/tyrosine aminotransferase